MMAFFNTPWLTAAAVACFVWLAQYSQEHGYTQEETRQAQALVERVLGENTFVEGVRGKAESSPLASARKDDNLAPSKPGGSLEDRQIAALVEVWGVTPEEAAKPVRIFGEDGEVE